MSPPDLSGGPVGNGWLGCGQAEILRQLEFLRQPRPLLERRAIIARCLLRNASASNSRLLAYPVITGERKKERRIGGAAQVFPAAPARFGHPLWSRRTTFPG